MAAPVLVSDPPRGLRVGPASDGDRCRDRGKQYSQTALWLQGDGFFCFRYWLSFFSRLGPPHVSHRDGGSGEFVFLIKHRSHLSAVSDYLERSALIALARVDSVPCADAVRLRLDANVRHRRLNRHPAGAASG